jgi:hypothetical protein
MTPPKPLNLNILIYALCFSVIGLVSITFANCIFTIPGTLHYKWVNGQLKNDPKLDCGKIQNDGLNQLLVAAGLIIAFKAKSDD